MIGGATVVVKAGDAANVGGFSFTLGRFTELYDTGVCDAKSQTTIAGFRLP